MRHVWAAVGHKVKCAVCELFHSEATYDCPGRPVTDVERSAIAAGDADFRDGKWREYTPIIEASH